jgi:hypothetical protein
VGQPATFVTSGRVKFDIIQGYDYLGNPSAPIATNVVNAQTTLARNNGQPKHRARRTSENAEAWQAHQEGRASEAIDATPTLLR